MAFVAHHLDLGADRIWLHFDDPEDAAIRQVSSHPRINTVRCDAPYWKATCGRRPDAHQNRQSRNIQRVCASADLPWIAHIDHDEFIVAGRPVNDTLAAVPAGQPLLRIEPFEALFDARLEPDIFTARTFRGALRGRVDLAHTARLFGAFAPMLPEGMLSHSVGKCFFRTGLPHVRPQIHGAVSGDGRVPGGAFSPDLALLHFHAADPDEWLSRLDFRLVRGAYRTRPDLQDYLLKADLAARRAFFDAVQTASAGNVAALDRLGRLRRHDLGLRDKVGKLLQGRI